VVDDEPVFAGAAKKVLSRAGYEVLTAEALAPAVALLRSRFFDAVITDLSLEGTKGLEGLEIGRLAKARKPDVKVILVTAFGSDEVSRQATESGVDLQLDKPVSLVLLKQVLSDFGLDRERRMVK
jgi:CheY-like chemotaxis protein